MPPFVSPQHPGRTRVLCVARSSSVYAALRSSFDHCNLEVLIALTPESAMAVCVDQVVAAAIVDCESIRDQEWSIIRSLKLVRPSLPIILLEARKHTRLEIMPPGVDAVVRLDHLNDLLTTLRDVLNCQSSSEQA